MLDWYYMGVAEFNTAAVKFVLDWNTLHVHEFHTDRL